MDFDAQRLFNAWTLVGHASYLLLVLSMMMRRMMSLRVLAIASGLLGVGYAVFYLRDWVSGVWEIAFVAVNLGQVALLLIARARSRLTVEETRLREGTFASFDDDEFLQLLSIGEWRYMEPGQELTVQGREVPELLLLVVGRADIQIDDKLVAMCRPGDFIGEIGFLSDQPATATAVASTPGRYLSFERGALRRLLQRESGLDKALGQVFNLNLVDKLVATSANASGEQPAQI